MAEAVDLAAKLALFSEHWTPKILADYNGNDVMVAKLKGEYHWHQHPDTDDFFLVLKGELTIRLRSGDVHLKAGERLVVPKGVEHQPVAEDECHILLVEPRGTPNSGDPATAAVKVHI
jgi:mannose-6-phosphate isomerase-like protein (cupin superfamily)